MFGSNLLQDAEILIPILPFLSKDEVISLFEPTLA